MPPFAHVLFCLGVGLAAPTLSFATLSPKPDAPVLVLAPPWISLEAVIEAAGGRPLGPVGAPFARLAVSADPAFAARVRRAGAWGVRDGSRLSELCGVRS